MAKLTDPQLDKREKIVKAMKRNFSDFKKRYGDDAKSVMYATSAKLAKNESVEFVAKFSEAISARTFADQLESYGITSNSSLHVDIDGSTSIIFESVRVLKSAVEKHMASTMIVFRLVIIISLQKQSIYKYTNISRKNVQYTSQS